MTASRSAAKSESILTQERVLSYLRGMFNPVRDLTPSTLATRLESFEAGYLDRLAVTMDKIEDRDDVLKGVASKRKKAVSRHGWEIVVSDDSPEAEAQKEALEFFYDNLTATSATDADMVGGARLLLNQMADAIGKRYAVHEIVWQPSSAGLTAEMRFVPLWFFEATIGKLRFLPYSGAVAGVDLASGEWMITRGEGLMIACSVLYLFKHMPLKDWIIYSERHGMPGLHGKTDASEGSTEWNALVDALQNFGVDWSMVTNRGAEVTPIDVSARGELPYPKLVERMDRSMAALWRGADLSTMSAGSGEGTGASLQGGESDLLEADDAQMLSETLNRQLDRWVVRYALGQENLLARIQIKTGTKTDVAQDMAVDTFLIRSGVPVSVNDLLERYGRTLPDDGEELATAPAAPADPGFPQLPAPNTFAPSRSGPRIGKHLARSNSRCAVRRGLTNRGGRASLPSFANAEPDPAEAHVAEVRGQARYVAAKLDAAAAAEMESGLASDLAPLGERLSQALDLDDAAFAAAAVRNVRAGLPDLLREMNASPRMGTAFENTLVAALFNGWAEGVEARA